MRGEKVIISDVFSRRFQLLRPGKGKESDSIRSRIEVGDGTSLACIQRHCQ